MEIYKEIEKVVSKPDSHSISTLTGGNDLIVSQINAFGKRRLVEPWGTQYRLMFGLF